jgi:hypothetical protein
VSPRATVRLTRDPHLEKMSSAFFERPILNSPYEYPARHWELDGDRQPTGTIVERRRADLINPIPKPKKRSAARASRPRCVLVMLINTDNPEGPYPMP